MTEIEQELAQFKEIDDEKKWLADLQVYYHKHQQAKRFDMADLVSFMIVIQKEYLRRLLQNGPATNPSGSQVPQALPGGSKTLFVLKK